MRLLENSLDLIFKNSKAGKGNPFACLFALLACTACSITATRPTQEMSDTRAAILAAKEIKADTHTPELYQEALEWYYRARKEYRFKNFREAQNYAEKARALAETAEFEAMRNGNIREATAPDPLQDSSFVPSRENYDTSHTRGEDDSGFQEPDTKKFADEYNAQESSPPPPEKKK